MDILRKEHQVALLTPGRAIRNIARSMQLHLSIWIIVNHMIKVILVSQLPLRPTATRSMVGRVLQMRNRSLDMENNSRGHTQATLHTCRSIRVTTVIVVQYMRCPLIVKSKTQCIHQLRYIEATLQHLSTQELLIHPTTPTLRQVTTTFRLSLKLPQHIQHRFAHHLNALATINTLSVRKCSKGSTTTL